MRLLSFFELSSVALGFLTLQTTARNVLAAVDGEVDASEFSSFWSSIRGTGNTLDVQSYELAGATLKQQAGKVEHLIVFGSSTKGLPAELSPQRLSTLVNSGSNILLALPPNSSDVWRDFAREFEIDMADRGSHAVDHFGFDLDADDGSHTALVLSLSHAEAPFVTPSTQHGPPALFRGALHSIGRSPLLQPILTVPSTTYSGQPGSQLEDLRYSGNRAVAVSGFQARNNARVSVVGSLDFLTDASANSPVRTETATHSKSGNSAFLGDLARWTFGSAGKRRVVSVRHGLSRESLSNPHAYRVRDEMHYEIEIESDAGEGPQDLQLEFTMLDPHLRIPLKSSRTSPGRQRFEATFTIPDRHGVFTLRVDHRRPGWSSIESATVISVTPPRHDEYERFIRGAIPYYGGALSVSVGLVAFVVFWIAQS
ncbi:hypothetical protein JCM16303_005369 [Sporobolomyces ruberrimus]